MPIIAESGRAELGQRLALQRNPVLFRLYDKTTVSMKTSFLDFEQPIADLEGKIEELRFVQDDSAVDISQEIDRLQKK